MSEGLALVQRTKRRLGPGKAAEMQAKVHDFHHQVRRWYAEIPVGGQFCRPVARVVVLMGLALRGLPPEKWSSLK